MGRVSRYLSQADRVEQFVRHMEANEKFKKHILKSHDALSALVSARGEEIALVERKADAMYARAQEMERLLFDALFAPWWSRRRRNARRELREYFA